MSKRNARKFVGTSLYFLRCPHRNIVRYIGISDKPKQRFSCHLAEARSRATNPTVKDKWILELTNEGLVPILDVVMSGLTREQALRVECRLVRQHVRLGHLVQHPYGTKYDVLYKSPIGDVVREYVVAVNELVALHGGSERLRVAFNKLRALGV